MSLFAVATVFNMNLSEQGRASDVSLEAIAVMAQATPEGEDNGYERVTVTKTETYTRLKCVGVGSVECKE